MSWSAGTFTRSNGATGWADDAAASIGITASRHDTLDNDLATGINTCLTKDGQNAATANLPMGGFRHTNVGNAAALTSYASAAQIVAGSLTYLGTSGGAANVQTLTPTIALTTYSTGQVFAFAGGFANTGSTSINISGLGAKTIKRQNGRALVGGEIAVSTVYQIMYNGTDFIILNPSSEWLTWGPAYTGFTVNPSSPLNYYKVSPDGNWCTVEVVQPNNGTSGATTFTITGPITALALTNAEWNAPIRYTDNGTASSTYGFAQISSASNTINLYTNPNLGAWTNVNGKKATFTLTYRI
jgi:hypothetical protein